MKHIIPNTHKIMTAKSAEKRQKTVITKQWHSTRYMYTVYQSA